MPYKTACVNSNRQKFHFQKVHFFGFFRNLLNAAFTVIPHLNIKAITGEIERVPALPASPFQYFFNADFKYFLLLLSKIVNRHSLIILSSKDFNLRTRNDDLRF